MPNANFRFSQNYSYFLVALALLLLGFILMAVDPADNGFGVLTLWIAPPILLAGFALPVLGILGADHFRTLHVVQAWKTNPVQHAGGLVAFLAAFVTYLVTLEPTASLWDCSEFIASAYKLQVPHTPGTPLSLLFGRMFTMLSFGNVKLVAWTVNMMSGLFSALAVWVVYHILCYLIQTLRPANTPTALVAVAALGGSLCMAFSDSFWYSAVEAETYGGACFFLVLLLWLILKGKDQPESQRWRWIILIAYVAGLAYCVHPMCLLVLPVLPFSWYTHQRPLTFWTIVATVGSGFLTVFLINRLVAIGFFELAFSMDFFFVNTLHFPFYSGALVLIILMIAVFYFVLKKYAALSTYTWAFIFLLVGFSPYALLFIRSGHNPPIDETNPENLYMIKAYMNRESYPSIPMLYGPYFDANIEEFTVKSKAYTKGTTAYELSGPLIEYEYEPARQTILPRLYSRDPDHIEAYRSWLDLKPGEKPRFADNLKFMFRAQLGHMYLRYFFFNFAGRESDVQGADWLKPWQSLHAAGDHPNPGRNQYWLLPFVAGALGMVFQFQKDRKGFLAVTVFFLLTGLILALYLNSPPVEPRERDYIYVGSYIAFCLWIGIGFFHAAHFMFTKTKSLMLCGALCALVPLWMFYQNFDDHNRAGRTFQVDNARNTLKSCAPNAILFTGGDNDTFPFWYIQEVEGFRTDVRVMVLSYFNTDWYIQQLRRPYYQSPPFAFTLDEKAYRQYGPNDVLYIQESIKEGIDAKKYLQLLKEEHSALRVLTAQGDAYNIVPSRTLKINLEPPVSKNKLTANDTAPVKGQVMNLKLTENYLQKNALALVDLIVSNHGERPIYFNFTSISTIGLDLKPYAVQEGVLYRLTPTLHDEKDIAVDKALTYKYLIEEADYANLANPRVYFNYEDFHARMIVPIRQSFNALAGAYLEEGNTEMAEKVLVQAVEKLYPPHLLPSYTNLQAADMLMALGRDEMAQRLTTSVYEYASDMVLQDREAGVRSSDLNLFLLQKSNELLKDWRKSDAASVLDSQGR
jgi:hypothetical protein